MTPNRPIPVERDRFEIGRFPCDLLPIDIQDIGRTVEDAHHMRPRSQCGRVRRLRRRLAPVTPPPKLQVAVSETQVQLTLGGGNEAAGDDVADTVLLFGADPGGDGTGGLVAEIQRGGLPKHHAGIAAAEPEGALVGARGAGDGGGDPEGLGREGMKGRGPKRHMIRRHQRNRRLVRPRGGKRAVARRRRGLHPNDLRPRVRVPHPVTQARPSRVGLFRLRQILRLPGQGKRRQNGLLLREQRKHRGRRPRLLRKIERHGLLKREQARRTQGQGLPLPFAGNGVTVQQQRLRARPRHGERQTTGRLFPVHGERQP